MFLPLVSYYWRRKALKETQTKYNALAIYSNAIVTLSNRCVCTLKDLIVVPNNAKIISIPNPNSFYVEDEPAAIKSKVILYVGRLSKIEKEPLRLLKIWEHLHQKCQDWCIKIVGDGDEKKMMHDYVKEHCLNNVIFEGRQSNVTQYYKEASFICLTSNFEGWGMALTEGMQYGCIPFTFNNYGAAFDIIDDGLNGCMIPAYDLKKYAKRLFELMSDESKRSEMSKAAIKKVRMFSVGNVVDRWEVLLKSL